MVLSRHLRALVYATQLRTLLGEQPSSLPLYSSYTCSAPGAGDSVNSKRCALPFSKGVRPQKSFTSRAVMAGASQAAPASALASPKDVLDFWFGAAGAQGQPDSATIKKWFTKDADFDVLCKEKAAHLLDDAASGKFMSWEESPDGSLALVILLDQFPRNIYRNSPQSFAYDAAALSATGRAIEKGFHEKVGYLQRSFFALPFEHSEDLADQEFACQLVRKLCEDVPTKSADVKEMCEKFLWYAEAHKDVIEQWGRFPHRNIILGRKSTPKEIEFLEKPGSSF